jgi:hypothetical protein
VSDTVAASIRLADSILGSHSHICAFFRDADKEYRVLLSFIKDGFKQGDKAFHIVDPELRAEPRRWLETSGIDLPAAEKTGFLQELRERRANGLHMPVN